MDRVQTVMIWWVLALTACLMFGQEAPKVEKAAAATTAPKPATTIVPAVPSNVQAEYTTRVIEILRLELQGKAIREQAVTKDGELKEYLRGQMEKVCGVGGEFSEDKGKLVCLPARKK